MALADINIERAKQSAAEIGDAAIAIDMDVTRQDSIDAGVAEAVEKMGRIDILINNAALFTAAPIVEIDRAEYDKVFAVNFTGAVFTLQAVAKHNDQARWCGARSSTWPPRRDGAARLWSRSTVPPRRR